MNRIIFVFILSIIFQTAISQNENKIRKLTLQLESGISLSTFVNANPDYALYKINLPLTPRYYLGISFNLPIFKGLGLKAGLFYEQKGVKAYYKGINTIDIPPIVANEIDVDFKLLVQNDYFSIPVGFTYHFKRKVSIFIEGGCHFDFLNKSSFEYERTIKYFDPDYPHSVYFYQYTHRYYQKAKLTRNFDYGPNIGISIGYEFPIGIGIFVNSKCELGMLNVDGVNHNEHTYTPYGLSSTNYYGISSDSKNFSIICGLQIYIKL